MSHCHTDNQCVERNAHDLDKTKGSSNHAKNGEGIQQIRLVKKYQFFLSHKSTHFNASWPFWNDIYIEDSRHLKFSSWRGRLFWFHCLAKFFFMKNCKKKEVRRNTKKVKEMHFVNNCLLLWKFPLLFKLFYFSNQ